MVHGAAMTERFPEGSPRTLDDMTTTSTTAVAERSRPNRTIRIASATLAAASIVAACGSDEPDAATGTIEIGATDFSYVDVPERVEAGASIELRNDSDAEVHELVAILLPDDEERPVSELVELPPEELAAFFPFVETVVVAPPGESGMVVEGTGTLSEAGRYALICVIPTGADPDEYLAAAAASEGGPPDVEGGPPHIVQGMFAELTVVD